MAAFRCTKAFAGSTGASQLYERPDLQALNSADGMLFAVPSFRRAEIMATVRPQFDIERDVKTVEAMASRLTPYVYENQLYGSMPGDLAKLTVGGLLMRL